MSGQKEIKKRVRAPKSTRLEAVELFITGKKDPWELRNDYNLVNSSYIRKWVKRHEAEVRERLSEKIVPLSPVMQEPIKNETANPLESENKRLKEMLYHSSLKIEALETLITLAEQNYQVSIRKNFAAKQSKRSGKGTVK
jgi:transposase-like protein